MILPKDIIFSLVSNLIHWIILLVFGVDCPDFIINAILRVLWYLFKKYLLPWLKARSKK